MVNFEIQYKNALIETLNNGFKCKNRTGIDSIAITGKNFQLKNIGDNFPILKGKKMFPRLPLIEMFWMLNGFSDVKWLNDRKVNYWNEWASKGNAIIPTGSIGNSYGYLMRNLACEDQLKNLIRQIIEDPYSRRLIISLWNPAELKNTTLPPCVNFLQFHCFKISNGFWVNLDVYQRSGDAPLGVPYDFMWASYFLTTICKIAEMVTGIKYIPNDISYTIGNFHIYENQIDN